MASFGGKMNSPALPSSTLLTDLEMLYASSRAPRLSPRTEGWSLPTKTDCGAPS